MSPRKSFGGALMAIAKGELEKIKKELEKAESLTEKARILKRLGNSLEEPPPLG